jgi:hypothetical protein
MYLLRRANINDIPKLIDFMIKFLGEVQKNPSNEEIEIFRNSLRYYFLDKMKSNEFIAWLAENDNRIIATSGLSFLINLQFKFTFSICLIIYVIFNNYGSKNGVCLILKQNNLIQHALKF